MTNQDKTKTEGTVLDHSYDGIQELDNPLPRWWVMMFVATFIFGFIYWLYYGLGGGPTLVEELERSMEERPLVSAAPIQAVAAIAFKEDPSHVAAGQKVFDTSCIACHAKGGAGLIGPNLADRYWIHGDGSLQEIYKAIRSGVPDKGMPAWEALLKPEDVENVTVYVKSLTGTNPEKPKAPQGVLIE